MSVRSGEGRCRSNLARAKSNSSANQSNMNPAIDTTFLIG